eukprot:CAMPEP_0204838550 /NCGR_PEP_ID=MMETSP1346-20131115/31304_1 /ASSEMBLY_ACC=CAM_ASM_000771 /TAXON_ID=215587 /ORGANISM="Aplanochytrium stocchinoi, Strain GSBS06" /LENGTH=113 /DNA_ID=CAMNT_0051974693 /DNA_START=807 /DNA_END=1148 /DNA_ORIENTATION=+
MEQKSNLSELDFGFDLNSNSDTCASPLAATSMESVNTNAQLYTKHEKENQQGCFDFRTYRYYRNHFETETKADEVADNRARPFAPKVHLNLSLMENMNEEEEEEENYEDGIFF